MVVVGSVWLRNRSSERCQNSFKECELFEPLIALSKGTMERLLLHAKEAIPSRGQYASVKAKTLTPCARILFDDPKNTPLNQTRPTYDTPQRLLFRSFSPLSSYRQDAKVITFCGSAITKHEVCSAATKRRQSGPSCPRKGFTEP